MKTALLEDKQHIRYRFLKTQSQEINSMKQLFDNKVIVKSQV